MTANQSHLCTYDHVLSRKMRKFKTQPKKNKKINKIKGGRGRAGGGGGRETVKKKRKEKK